MHGGRDIQVNETNVYDYVRLYANYRMIKTQEKSLEVRISASKQYMNKCIHFSCSPFTTIIYFGQTFAGTSFGRF